MRRRGGLIAEIERCVEANVFPPTVKPAVAMRLLMLGLLGVAVLTLSDRLAPGENPDQLASDVLDTTLAGLRSGVPLQSQGIDPDCVMGEPIPDAQAS